MKIVSLRDMTRDELLQKQYFNLKMRKSLKELDNPLKLRTLRRDIARIETILTEDKKDIRKIVDSKVSILDRKTDAKAESSSEEGK